MNEREGERESVCVSLSTNGQSKPLNHLNQPPTTTTIHHSTVLQRPYATSTEFITPQTQPHIQMGKDDVVVFMPEGPLLLSACVSVSVYMFVCLSVSCMCERCTHTYIQVYTYAYSWLFDSSPFYLCHHHLPDP